MRVAMIATPWLPVPPEGYGGTENVINALVPELTRMGTEVELFTTGDSTVQATKKHWVYKTGQYNYIHEPMYVSSPILAAHLLYAVNAIRADGNFDIVHDHNGYIGAFFFSQQLANFPPVIHTLHSAPFTTDDRLKLGLPDNRLMWKEIGKANKVRLVGISDAITKSAPRSLKSLLMPTVHNAVETADFPFVKKKEDYFITLARFHPEKGQALAVRACMKLNVPLKMAGPVGELTTPKRVMMELANPLSPHRSLEDFKYFSDYIFPYLHDELISYVGNLGGERKLRFISRAKALLFPIDWEEPFGMAPIEALACGTPVIAMARGALPEIIKHGVNGFLARNEREFIDYMKRIGEIDPADCRKSVEERFSARIMAKNYMDRYEQLLNQ